MTEFASARQRRKQNLRLPAGVSAVAGFFDGLSRPDDETTVAKGDEIYEKYFDFCIEHIKNIEFSFWALRKISENEGEVAKLLLFIFQSISPCSKSSQKIYNLFLRAHLEKTGAQKRKIRFKSLKCQ